MIVDPCWEAIFPFLYFDFEDDYNQNCYDEDERGKCGYHDLFGETFVVVVVVAKKKENCLNHCLKMIIIFILF